MEEEIGKLSDHPVVGPVAMAQLNRREALEQDLTYYFGDSWKDDIKPSPSAAVCVERIHAVAQGVPRAVGGAPLHSLPRRSLGWSDPRTSLRRR